MDGSVTALVPMKAHSERVPNKNVRDFNGRPLFHWILATLEAASSVESILVNTDSERIAREASEEFGVETIERPSDLRGDFVSMNEIILHDVEHTGDQHYLQTHCTNPLLRPETVDGAVEAFFEDSVHDSLFTVTPLQTRLWDGDCEPINHRRDELQRTQDLPPVYEENSNLYVFSADSVRARNNRIGDSPKMHEMEAEEAIDIDEPIDFRTAEFLHADRYGEEPSLTTVTSS
jgi:CMP-N-acetylneuraminic acid synthetase